MFLPSLSSNVKSGAGCPTLIRLRSVADELVASFAAGWPKAAGLAIVSPMVKANSSRFISFLSRRHKKSEMSVHGSGLRHTNVAPKGAVTKGAKATGHES